MKCLTTNEVYYLSSVLLEVQMHMNIWKIVCELMLSIQNDDGKTNKQQKTKTKNCGIYGRDNKKLVDKYFNTDYTK